MQLTVVVISFMKLTFTLGKYMILAVTGFIREVILD